MSKNNKTYDELVADYGAEVIDDPTEGAVIPQITNITPENVAEIIADSIDGIFDDGFEVAVSAVNSRHAVHIRTLNEDLGIDNSFILFVKVDNAA